VAAWQSHISYHPSIGFTFTPNHKARLAHEAGGYLIRTNAAGFRSEREFVAPATPGKFRILLFGDSQTAGYGVGNRDRFSDVLETLLPNTEVYNFALDGTGTDQQYLAWCETADIEHDLLVIAPYVEDIDRVNSPYQRFIGADGGEVFYAKPWFEPRGDALVLNNVPVPKRPWTEATRPPVPQQRPGWRAPARVNARAAYRLLPASLRHAVRSSGLFDLGQKMIRIQHAPGYARDDNPDWLLLRAILAQWISESRVPVLLLPIPMYTFVEETADAQGYQTRFRELAAATSAWLHDPLLDLRGFAPDDRRSFRFATDPHLTRAGHRAMAESLAPAVASIITQVASAMSES
jgi:lysophospholipase L1-like esterase